MNENERGTKKDRLRNNEEIEFYDNSWSCQQRYNVLQAMIILQKSVIVYISVHIRNVI